MDKANSKILTLSFAIAGALTGLTVHLLLKSFSGAFGIVARLTSSDLIRHGLPVAVGIILFLVLQFHPRVLAWGEEVVIEVKKVIWPTQKETTAMTIVVIIMVLISSLLVTSFDVMSGAVLSFMMRNL